MLKKRELEVLQERLRELESYVDHLRIENRQLLELRDMIKEQGRFLMPPKGGAHISSVSSDGIGWVWLRSSSTTSESPSTAPCLEEGRMPSL